MAELQDDPPPPPSATSPPPESVEPPPTPPPPRFDPSRMIGIIRRKALIKDLAAAYHAECLTYCQELLELQRKCEELQDFQYGGDASLKMSYRSSNMFVFNGNSYCFKDLFTSWTQYNSKGCVELVH
ncbi:hypothetical protein AgCh_027831 [Apium graveolens]